MILEGTATALRVLRADGQSYGVTASPKTAQAHAEAYEAMLSPLAGMRAA